MKKTLLALAAASVCASSAQAYVVLDNQDSGTKLDFYGSARIKWESSSNKTQTAAGTTREHINHAVDNNGSRFGLKINQQLGGGFYALGNIQFRFRGDAPSQHDFDHIYVREAYAGIGHKEYGELTHGNMTVITDEVKRTDLANTNSLSDGLLRASARKVTQYVYKGVEGLKVGVFYGGKNQRGMDGVKTENQRKDVWGVGAVYSYKLDDIQSIKLGTGFTRERTNQANVGVFTQNAYSVAGAYTFDGTTVGLDLERRVTKDQGAIGNKRVQREVRTVIHQAITPDWNAYAMYAFRHNVLNSATGSETKQKNHEFMVGSEYYVYQQDSLKVKPFVEWKTVRANRFVDDVKTRKTRDNVTIVGLRAYW